MQFALQEFWHLISATASKQKLSKVCQYNLNIIVYFAYSEFSEIPGMAMSSYTSQIFVRVCAWLKIWALQACSSEETFHHSSELQENLVKCFIFIYSHEQMVVYNLSSKTRL